MAGYSDTKKLIEDTLVGRPEGSLIYPYQHQRFALSMLDYIHSVELMGVSDLQGIATTDTVPVEPENAKVAYIATVPPSQTYVYTNFLDENGDPITITTGANTVSLLTLLWNGTYWQVQNSPVQLAVDYSDGFLLKDVISTDVNPGTPDLNMFYIALPGTYTHFTVAPITVKQGQLGIFTYENSAWSSEVFTIANWSVVNVNDINGSATAYGSSQIARTMVPLQYRKCGLQITYLLSTGWITEQYIGPDESASTPTPWPNWGTSSNWQVLGPVSVSQNSQTGKTELLIGNTPALIVDNEPETGSDNLVKSGGVAEKISQLGQYVDDPNYLYIMTDSENRILFSVKKDGSIEWSVGIPRPIKNELMVIASQILEINDSKVDKENGKSLINEDFANGISYPESSDLATITDANNRVLGRILSNGKVDFPTQVMSDVEIDNLYVYKMVNSDGRVLLGVKQDLTIDWFVGIPNAFTENIKDVINKKSFDAYLLNKRQEQNLLAAARYNTSLGKCVQMMLVSDSHGGFIGVERASEICKNIPSIDAIMHMGDMVGWTPNEVKIDEVALTIAKLKNSNRPFFIACGNHDVGTIKDIYFTRTHEQVFTDMVKPMIDDGILSSGEYQTTGDWAERCYYYHDFNTTKIRLIVLYDYDMDLVLDDNEYWDAVAYDSSKGKIQPGTTYIYDPNNPIILNCGGWKNNSFRLKKTVTTITSSINNYTSGTFPWYKLRSFSYHSKAQMDWLANVLNTTPDGYGIVIATHQSPVFPATISDNDFSIGSNPQNTYHPNSGVPGDTVMQTALVMKIVNAWKNKTSIIERIVAKDAPTTTTLQTSDYLNALEDGSGKYAYIFNADFSNRQNNNAYFINFIAGHEHCDIIEDSVDYPELFCLLTTTSNPTFRYMSDMPYSEELSSPIYDCLTVLTWAEDRNIACKWGCTRTIAGIDRKYVKL